MRTTQDSRAYIASITIVFSRRRRCRRQRKLSREARSVKRPRRFSLSTWTHHAPRAVFTAPSIDRIRRQRFNSNRTEAPPFPRRLDCNGRPGTKRSVRPPPRRKHRLKLAKAKRRPHAAIRTSGNGRPHRLSASGLSSIIREPRRWWITIHRYWVLLKNSHYWGVFPVFGVRFLLDPIAPLP